MSRTVTVSTSAAGIDYTVQGLLFESVDEATEMIDGGSEGVLEVLNSAQEQNFKQNAKGPVREAVRAAKDAGIDEETLQDVVDGDVAPEDTVDPDAASAVIDAIGDHRENAEDFVTGRPRGRAGGVTKTDARTLGERIREKADGDPDKMRDIADTLGIDAEDLF